MWEGPLGPHPVAMFEVNLFTPGKFVLSSFERQPVVGAY